MTNENESNVVAKSNYEPEPDPDPVLPFDELEMGDIVRVKVEATGGDLMLDETWTDELEYISGGTKDTGSRTESHTFRHIRRDETVRMRFSAHHENNLGFVKSRREPWDVDYKAGWYDFIVDDRDWKAVEGEIVDKV